MKRSCSVLKTAACVAAFAGPGLAARAERLIQLVGRPYVIESGVFSGPGEAAVDGFLSTARLEDGEVVFDAPPETEWVWDAGWTVVVPADAGADEGATRIEPRPAAVFTAVITSKSTPWMRVRLSDYYLGDHSFIEIRSLRDGDRQRLDSWSLPIWSKTSAIFNGDKAELTLFLDPRDEGVFVNVGEVLVADPLDFGDGSPPPDQGGDEPESICGDFDDRVPSNDSRCGRLFFGGCTGWLVHNGAALTAGHCGTPDGNLSGVVMEFNVPASSSNGVPVPASVNDQYPVTGVVSTEANGEGQDYNVFSVGPNSNTLAMPHIVQGFYIMTAEVPNEGATLRVTGYGIDNIPSGPGGFCCELDGMGNCVTSNCNSASATQQTDTGACDDCLVDTAIEHTVDTMPANSGSPIIWESNGLTIAIHAQGGCDTVWSDFDNAGTWLAYLPLWSALQYFQGSNPVWVAPLVTGPQNGEVLRPFNSVAAAVSAAPNGSNVFIVAGSYTQASGNVFTVGTGWKALTLFAPVGTATIGN